jgi:hypothetical protein
MAKAAAKAMAKAAVKAMAKEAKAMAKEDVRAMAKAKAAKAAAKAMAKAEAKAEKVEHARTDKNQRQRQQRLDSPHGMFLRATADESCGSRVDEIPAPVQQSTKLKAFDRWGCLMSDRAFAELTCFICGVTDCYDKFVDDAAKKTLHDPDQVPAVPRSFNMQELVQHLREHEKDSATAIQKVAESKHGDSAWAGASLLEAFKNPPRGGDHVLVDGDLHRVLPLPLSQRDLGLDVHPLRKYRVTSARTGVVQVVRRGNMTVRLPEPSVVSVTRTLSSGTGASPSESIERVQGRMRSWGNMVADCLATQAVSQGMSDTKVVMGLGGRAGEQDSPLRGESHRGGRGRHQYIDDEAGASSSDGDDVYPDGVVSETDVGMDGNVVGLIDNSPRERSSTSHACSGGHSPGDDSRGMEAARSIAKVKAMVTAPTVLLVLRLKTCDGVVADAYSFVYEARRRLWAGWIILRWLAGRHRWRYFMLGLSVEEPRFECVRRREGCGQGNCEVALLDQDATQMIQSSFRTCQFLDWLRAIPAAAKLLFQVETVMEVTLPCGNHSSIAQNGAHEKVDGVVFASRIASAVANVGKEALGAVVEEEDRVQVVTTERGVDVRDLDAGCFDSFVGIQGEAGALEVEDGRRTTPLHNSAAALWKLPFSICSPCSDKLRLSGSSRQPPIMPRWAVAQTNLGWQALQEIALLRGLGHILGDPDRPPALPRPQLLERRSISTGRTCGSQVLKVVPPGREREKRKPIWHHGITGSFVTLYQAAAVSDEHIEDLKKSRDGDQFQVVFAATRAAVMRNRHKLRILRVSRRVLLAFRSFFKFWHVNVHIPPSRRRPPSLLDHMDEQLLAVPAGVGDESEGVPNGILEKAVYASPVHNTPVADTAYAVTSRSQPLPIDQEDVEVGQFRAGDRVYVGEVDFGQLVDQRVDATKEATSCWNVRFADGHEAVVSADLLTRVGDEFAPHVSGVVDVEPASVQAADVHHAGLMSLGRKKKEEIERAATDEASEQTPPRVFVHTPQGELMSDFHCPSTTHALYGYQFPYHRGGNGNYKKREGQDAFHLHQGASEEALGAYQAEPLQRLIAISDNGYVLRALHLFGGLFATDSHYLLQETNRRQKREAIHRTLRLKSKVVDNCGSLDRLLQHVNEEVARLAGPKKDRQGIQGSHSAEGPAQVLKQALEYAGSSVIVSPIQRHRLQSAFFAKIMAQGPNDLFITVSPSDVHDIRISKLNGKPHVMLDFPCTWPDVWQRQNTAAGNGVAVARWFLRLATAFFDAILNFPIGARRARGSSILGAEVVGFDFTVEGENTFGWVAEGCGGVAGGL